MVSPAGFPSWMSALKSYSSKAYLFSLQAPKWDGLIQIDGLILFRTPHFLAGLAQWALISAKKLGIPCNDSPQQQDWSESTLGEDLKSISEIQKEFRNLDSELKMACYFSSLPVPQSKLVSTFCPLLFVSIQSLSKLLVLITWANPFLRKYPPNGLFSQVSKL